MRKRTYYLPDPMIEKLEKISDKKGVPVSEIIRRFLDEKIEEINDDTTGISDEGRSDGESDT